MMTNPLSADLNHVLEHTRDLWEDLRGERIFITGGTGFFGCWLLESLLWANDQLNLDCRATVLTRDPDLFRKKAPHLAEHESVSFIKGDIRTFEFPSGSFSHLIHAATETNLTSASIDALTLFNANLEGAQRVLKLARIAGVRRFLFTSSGAVYGKQQHDLTHIPEDYGGAPDTTDIRSAYGQSKRTVEFLFTIYAHMHKVDVKIARCFAFVGPYLPLHTNYAIGNFIADALNHRPIQISGDGTPYRSYLYAADLAIWLWTILFKGKSCYPYNVGSEKDLSIAELAKAVAHAIAPKLQIQIAQQHNEGQPIERYVPMAQRAKKELGLQEFIDLADAIGRTAHWYLSNHSKG